MTLVKCHLNAVVSENAHFGTLDITDYYLGADMPADDIQSLKIYLDDYPSSLLDELGLSPFLQTDRYNATFVYADIVKTVPGLKNSGLLSQNRLIRHLATCGYHQTATPMLFRHATRDISFTLVVDDFGIKYTALSDYDHLKSSLELLYKVTSSPIGTRYLGFDIDYDRQSRVMRLSLGGYISKLLKSAVPESVKLRMYDSPMIYTPPVFGSTAPQIAPVDSSPLASSSDGRLLQTVVGSLLYYARAIDTLMLTAVCNLSTLQSSPTLDTMNKMYRLLGYAAKHPNACQYIVPSDMTLRVQSDASHLSRPNSKSVAGGIHWLGTSDPFFLNAPIYAHSTTIPVVTAAVSESEYAGVFANGQVAVDERSILSSLGYPQTPTTILCDNECACGLASETVRAKKSKAIDMRFDWTRCRVHQHQFRVSHIAGSINLADLLTKALPAKEHTSLAPLYVHYPPSVPTLP